MKKVLDILLKALSEDVILTVSPDVVYARRKDIDISVKTSVFLLNDEKKLMVVGVGEDLGGFVDNRRVDLFKTDSWNQSIPSKKEVLIAFFSYCIRKVQKSHRIIVSPRVVVRNASSLRDVLCGYQEDLIRGALIGSGAREVVFEV